MGRVECKNQLCSLMKVPALSAKVLIYVFNSESCFQRHLLLLKFSDVNVNRHEQNPNVLKCLNLQDIKLQYLLAFAVLCKPFHRF